MPHKKSLGLFFDIYISELLKKQKRTGARRGFTITEVLIALLVIAVIIVLILPVVTTRAQNKSFALSYQTEVKQMLGSLQALPVNENKGDITQTMMYVQNDESDDYTSTSGAYINKYMKVVKFCGNTPKGCFADDYYEYKDDERVSFDMGDKVGACALLKNGVSICLKPQIKRTSGRERITGWIDLNGPKAPNIYGRDLRTFSIDLNNKAIFTEEDPTNVILPDPPEPCVGEGCNPEPEDPCEYAPLSKPCCDKQQMTKDHICCIWYKEDPSHPNFAICNEIPPCPEDDPDCMVDACKNHVITGPTDECCAVLAADGKNDPKCCSNTMYNDYCCNLSEHQYSAGCCLHKMEKNIAGYPKGSPQAIKCCEHTAVASKYPALCGKNVCEEDINSEECCKTSDRMSEIAEPTDNCCSYADVSNQVENCCRLQSSSSDVCCKWKYDNSAFASEDACCQNSNHGLAKHADLVEKCCVPGKIYGVDALDEKCCDYLIGSDYSKLGNSLRHCCEFSIFRDRPECCSTSDGLTCDEAGGGYSATCCMADAPNPHVNCCFDSSAEWTGNRLTKCCSYGDSTYGSNTANNQTKWQENCCSAGAAKYPNSNSYISNCCTSASNWAGDCCTTKYDSSKNIVNDATWQSKCCTMDSYKTLSQCCLISWSDGCCDSVKTKTESAWLTNCCSKGASKYPDKASFRNSCCTDGEVNSGGNSSDKKYCCDPNSTSPTKACCEAFQAASTDDKQWVDFDGNNLTKDYMKKCCAHGVCAQQCDIKWDAGQYDYSECCASLANEVGGSGAQYNTTATWKNGCCEFAGSATAGDKGKYASLNDYRSGCCDNSKDATFKSSNRGTNQSVLNCCIPNSVKSVDASFNVTGGVQPAEACCKEFEKRGWEDYSGNSLNTMYKQVCCNKYGICPNDCAFLSTIPNSSLWNLPNCCNDPTMQSQHKNSSAWQSACCASTVNGSASGKQKPGQSKLSDADFRQYCCNNAGTNVTTKADEEDPRCCTSSNGNTKLRNEYCCANIPSGKTDTTAINNYCTCATGATQWHIVLSSCCTNETVLEGLGDTELRTDWKNKCCTNSTVSGSNDTTIRGLYASYCCPSLETWNSGNVISKCCVDGVGNKYPNGQDGKCCSFLRNSESASDYCCNVYKNNGYKKNNGSVNSTFLSYCCQNGHNANWTGIYDEDFKNKCCEYAQSLNDSNSNKATFIANYCPDCSTSYANASNASGVPENCCAELKSAHISEPKWKEACCSSSTVSLTNNEIKSYCCANDIGGLYGGDTNNVCCTNYSPTSGCCQPDPTTGQYNGVTITGGTDRGCCAYEPSYDWQTGQDASEICCSTENFASLTGARAAKFRAGCCNYPALRNDEANFGCCHWRYIRRKNYGATELFDINDPCCSDQTFINKYGNEAKFKEWCNVCEWTGHSGGDSATDACCAEKYDSVSEVDDNWRNGCCNKNSYKYSNTPKNISCCTWRYVNQLLEDGDGCCEILRNSKSSEQYWKDKCSSTSCPGSASGINASNADQCCSLFVNQKPDYQESYCCRRYGTGVENDGYDYTGASTISCCTLTPVKNASTGQYTGTGQSVHCCSLGNFTEWANSCCGHSNYRNSTFANGNNCCHWRYNYGIFDRSSQDYTSNATDGCCSYGGFINESEDAWLNYCCSPDYLNSIEYRSKTQKDCCKRIYDAQSNHNAFKQTACCEILEVNASGYGTDGNFYDGCQEPCMDVSIAQSDDAGNIYYNDKIKECCDDQNGTLGNWSNNYCCRMKSSTNSYVSPYDSWWYDNGSTYYNSPYYCCDPRYSSTTGVYAYKPYYMNHSCKSGGVDHACASYKDDDKGFYCGEVDECMNWYNNNTSLTDTALYNCCNRFKDSLTDSQKTQCCANSTFKTNNKSLCCAIDSFKQNNLNFCCGTTNATNANDKACCDFWGKDAVRGNSGVKNACCNIQAYANENPDVCTCPGYYNASGTITCTSKNSSNNLLRCNLTGPNSDDTFYLFVGGYNKLTFPKGSSTISEIQGYTLSGCTTSYQNVQIKRGNTVIASATNIDFCKGFTGSFSYNGCTLSSGSITQANESLCYVDPCATVSTSNANNTCCPTWDSNGQITNNDSVKTACCNNSSTYANNNKAYCCSNSTSYRDNNAETCCNISTFANNNKAYCCSHSTAYMNNNKSYCCGNSDFKVAHAGFCCGSTPSTALADGFCCTYWHENYTGITTWAPSPPGSAEQRACCSNRYFFDYYLASNNYGNYQFCCTNGASDAGYQECALGPNAPTKITIQCTSPGSCYISSNKDYNAYGEFVVSAHCNQGTGYGAVTRYYKVNSGIALASLNPNDHLQGSAIPALSCPFGDQQVTQLEHCRIISPNGTVLLNCMVSGNTCGPCVYTP